MAFLRMAKTHHPDANPKSRDAVRKFQAAAEAHAVLSSDDDKFRYDREMGIKRVRARTSNITAPRDHPVNRRPIDHDEWYAWHYGPSHEPPEETPKNPHTAFFKRQTQRPKRDDIEVLNIMRKEKDNIVNRLVTKRRNRSPRVVRVVSYTDEGSCTIS